MAIFTKGTWQDRVSENITRRALTVVSATGESGIAQGDVITADVARADTTVSVQGTPFSHATMDDLETRISDAFDMTESKVNNSIAGEVLYDSNNNIGSKGIIDGHVTFTLIKNIQDYDYAEIIYRNTRMRDPTYRTTKIFPKYNKNWELWFAYYDDTGNDHYVNFDLKNIYANGTSISTHHVGHGDFASNGRTGTAPGSSRDDTEITKVIGYKNNI